MGTHISELRRSNWGRGVAVAAVLFTAAVAVAPAQFPQRPAVIFNPREIPPEPQVSDRVARERNVARQKKLESQMRRLQQLTTELHAEVNASDKEADPVDVAKKSEQIEKLAKSVHDLMIGPLT